MGKEAQKTMGEANLHNVQGNLQRREQRYHNSS